MIKKNKKTNNKRDKRKQKNKSNQYRHEYILNKWCIVRLVPNLHGCAGVCTFSVENARLLKKNKQVYSQKDYPCLIQIQFDKPHRMRRALDHEFAHFAQFLFLYVGGLEKSATIVEATMHSAKNKIYFYN